MSKKQQPKVLNQFDEPQDLTNQEVPETPPTIVEKVSTKFDKFLEKESDEHYKQEMFELLERIQTPDLRRIYKVQEMIENNYSKEDILEALVGFHTINNGYLEEFKSKLK